MRDEFALQPFDQTTILMTTIFTVFFLIMLSGLIYLWRRHGGSLMFRTGLLFGIGVCISGFVLPLLFAPKGIVITKDEIVLQSPLLSEHLTFGEVQSVRPLVEGDLVGVIRTFGVGSLWGNYTSPQLSSHDMKAIIDQAKAAYATLKLIVFSGGECFLLGSALFDTSTTFPFTHSIRFAIPRREHDTRTFNNEKWEPSTWHTEAKGVGLTEAPRGALAHWIVIKDKKIDNYQLVVPSTWNASPRDPKGQMSAYESALIGTPVKNPDQPLEILRTIHSFDPCLACAVHVYDEKGRYIHQFNTM